MVIPVDLAGIAKYIVSFRLRFSFSSVHDESGRVAGANLFDEVGWEKGTVAEPAHDIQFIRLVLGIGGPFPILLVGNPGTDVATG